MKVLFLQNIKGVAQIGDIKAVSDGYARNFLLPRKMAKAATADAVKLSEVLKQQRSIQDSNRKQFALDIAPKIETLSLVFLEDANSEGHLYGSVDEKKIAHELKKHGINIEPDDVSLPHHLKQVGEHKVALSVHGDVPLIINIKIEANKNPAE